MAALYLKSTLGKYTRKKKKKPTKTSTQNPTKQGIPVTLTIDKLRVMGTTTLKITVDSNISENTQNHYIHMLQGPNLIQMSLPELEASPFENNNRKRSISKQKRVGGT